MNSENEQVTNANCNFNSNHILLEIQKSWHQDSKITRITKSKEIVNHEEEIHVHSLKIILVNLK